MKKIIRPLLILITIGLAACTSKPYETDVSHYQGESAQAIFAGGEQHMAKHEFSDAVKNFEALDTLYPFGPLAQQAQLEIIYAYDKDSNSAAAMAAAERYIRLYPRDRHTDYAYYMRGILGFDEGMSWLQKLMKVDPAPHDLSTLDDSYRYFRLLTTNFPNSHYANDAAKRMVYIRNIMARQQVLIARFYFRHQAYLAAANRASTVAQHFQSTPSVPEALAIMTKSYQQLGLPKMAQASHQLLLKNHPQAIRTHRVKAKA